MSNDDLKIIDAVVGDMDKKVKWRKNSKMNNEINKIEEKISLAI